MMVSEYAYSVRRNRLRTIVTKNRRNQRRLRLTVRQKKGLSHMDKEILNWFYECGNRKYVAHNWVDKGGKVPSTGNILARGN